MNKIYYPSVRNITGLLIILTLINFLSVYAQEYKPTPNDTLTSVIVKEDNSVTFRIYAPEARVVNLGGSDIPGLFTKGRMNKTENGIWEITVDPLAPGAYRYNFVVDGVTVLDPKRPDVSESNMNAWSLMYVPGGDFMELKNVPHGSVSEVTYFSASLNRFRRMHVYTPPGYENNNEKYPVFYLLHGALDCDDSWTTVGRAGFILDNLIAEKKAAPMVVVMPAGHTGPFRFGMAMDGFIKDFNMDIKPFIENHYRILTERENTAMAGLSMGGGHTLDIGIPGIEEYAYLGVFSSGVFGITGGNSFGSNSGTTWEERNKQILDDKKLKEGLKLVWFATGKDDFLIETSRATVKMLNNHGFNVVYKETPGGHTWNNWRDYLYEFAQLLFKN